ncbi:hypothetical protein RM780_07465 [Streptomyces sp. DSM 44917]|uniref:Uncharacterized protein n=1 Tax=Streptomyces boetiae TaxID=3075541 RepID=A0ABU2L5F7_9ACTN|nr:hypothetical protein [Streptomyces sp. DSM 44917]MDT0306800.1 hypothetical protein [Streptomyces sp. DSM 44917]
MAHGAFHEIAHAEARIAQLRAEADHARLAAHAAAARRAARAARRPHPEPPPPARGLRFARILHPTRGLRRILLRRFGA